MAKVTALSSATSGIEVSGKSISAAIHRREVKRGSDDSEMRARTLVIVTNKIVESIRGAALASADE